MRVGAVQVAGRDGVQIRSAGDLVISGGHVTDSLEVVRAGVHSSQGDVGLHSAKDLTLAATDVSGRDVKVDARRNLNLTTVESRKLQEKRDDWSNRHPRHHLGNPRADPDRERIATARQPDYCQP